METKLESLQNHVNSIQLEGLKVHHHFNQDKRKKNQMFFLQIGSETISPTLDYTNMNHFLLGMSKMKKIINKI